LGDPRRGGKKKKRGRKKENPSSHVALPVPSHRIALSTARKKKKHKTEQNTFKKGEKRGKTGNLVSGLIRPNTLTNLPAASGEKRTKRKKEEEGGDMGASRPGKREGEGGGVFSGLFSKPVSLIFKPESCRYSPAAYRERGKGKRNKKKR